MSAPAATPRLDAAIHALTLTMALAMLTISPMALGALGWNYDAPGGSGPTRFHPATYLAATILLLGALRDGNPLTSLGAAFFGDARLALFLLAWALLLLHGTMNQGLPAAAPIDTFLLPLIILVIHGRAAPATRHRLAWLIHGGLALNALVGLGEFATGLRLTPYVAGGVAITGDWRSTALLGHPLGNALITGCYTATLLVGGGRELAGPARGAAIALQTAAMIAFGGRASLVLLVLFLLAALGRQMFRALAGARTRLSTLTVLAFVVPAGLGLVGLLAEAGFFEKFLLRFTEDKGSANARVLMFELFDGFTWPELLFGPPQAHLGYLVNLYRLEYGIESFWVAFSLYYGLLPALVFFAGLLFFLAALAARCRPAALVILGYFFVVNSSFLGIAGKTIGFATLILMLLTLLPAVPDIARSAPIRSFPVRRPLPC
ncbi:VpsF family polysaccharide biosynthesis protein [Rhabdaerophilum calidifontis]|uniref:VpsF family polysaccharide biosynthesis protein n=1 Tax=Rhabdaerophilum calidifontis TaxID=2604328 RepID=UPI00123A1684|nr:VpsF family polysaccharide biosynthesis protein [Rhabdaerophilum calidifontis]